MCFKCTSLFQIISWFKLKIKGKGHCNSVHPQGSVHPHLSDRGRGGEPPTKFLKRGA